MNSVYQLEKKAIFDIQRSSIPKSTTELHIYIKPESVHLKKKKKKKETLRTATLNLHTTWKSPEESTYKNNELHQYDTPTPQTHTASRQKIVYCKISKLEKNKQSI